MRLLMVATLLVAACSSADVTPSPAPTDSSRAAPTVAQTAIVASASATLTPGPTAAPTLSLAPTATAASAYDPAMVVVLQPVLDKWLKTDHVPGAVLGLRLSDGRTAVVASGVADETTGVAAATSDRFRIGSITKTFVATLILQLAADGHVRFEDRLSTYLRDAPHAGQITIRELLNHTSGLADFGAEPAYRLAILSAPARRWTAQETIGLIADKPLQFKPGTKWAYSNTNYTLLGMVAESVTGKPLADLLREQIYEALGLQNTFLDELEPAPPVVEVGHYDVNGDGKSDNVGAIPYTALVTSGAAAGGMSSTALDVIEFGQGLFDGRLLTADSLDQMLTITPPSTTYGLGIARLKTGKLSGWGHGGAIPGFTTLLARGDDGSIFVAMANQTGVDVDSLVQPALAAAKR